MTPPRLKPFLSLVILGTAVSVTAVSATGVHNAHRVPVASGGECHPACRSCVVTPEATRFPSIEPYRRGGTTSFDPAVASIVARMSSAAFAQRVGELSGRFPVFVDGQCTTFTTRYSLAPEAALSWAYAFDVLESAGWDVAYHSYTRSGNDLQNVVATKLGTTTPDQVYVLGGHIDSISPQPTTLAPGAEDNATGSAGVLLAAFALAEYQFESTIELVLFSGEEQGLWGSRAYVEDAINAGRDLRAAVTCDMIGWYDEGYGVLIEGESAWVALMVVMGDAVAAYTDLGQEFSFFSFGSDHVSFQDANIPAILAIDLDWDVYPDYHRTTDVYENVIPEFGVQIARAATATIAHLAGLAGGTVGVPGTTPPLDLVLLPNPATRFLTIVADTGVGETVEIFGLDGRLLRRLGAPGRGSSQLTWDLTDARGHRVPTGVYIVRMGKRSQRLVALH